MKDLVFALMRIYIYDDYGDIFVVLTLMEDTNVDFTLNEVERLKK